MDTTLPAEEVAHRMAAAETHVFKAVFPNTTNHYDTWIVYVRRTGRKPKPHSRFIMKYTASIQLKQADTEGRIPASILDEYIREELLRQLGIALKPRLVIRRGRVDEDSRTKSLASQVNFTTKLVILQADQWHQLKEQLNGWYRLLFPDEKHRLDDLILSLETANRST